MLNCVRLVFKHLELINLISTIHRNASLEAQFSIGRMLPSLQVSLLVYPSWTIFMTMLVGFLVLASLVFWTGQMYRHVPIHFQVQSSQIKMAQPARTSRRQFPPLPLHQEYGCPGSRLCSSVKHSRGRASIIVRERLLLMSEEDIFFWCC